MDGARKERRGFASMSREKQREIASKGGRAAHEKGRGGRGRLVPIPAQQDMHQPPGMVRRD